jgi:hypothetical protein
VLSKYISLYKVGLQAFLKIRLLELFIFQYGLPIVSFAMFIFEALSFPEEKKVTNKKTQAVY